MHVMRQWFFHRDDYLPLYNKHGYVRKRKLPKQESYFSDQRLHMFLLALCFLEIHRAF